MTIDKRTTRHQLIVHIIFRFDYGGLENGVSNLINALSDGSFRHVVIALTEATEFCNRLNSDTTVYALGKKPGKDLMAYFRLYKLLRELRPSVVHTRNIGTLDCALVAWLARVPVRIHGEHGWDVFDPDGTNPKYRRNRRILSRFVHLFVTVSADLRDWLIDEVGVPSIKVRHIYNGVDTERFHQSVTRPRSELPGDFHDKDTVVVGTVTRFSQIKDPLNLIEAFIVLCEHGPPGDPSMRLVMLGDGELRQRALERLEGAGLAGLAWLPGSRDDIGNLLNILDIFVLSSFREGISNTILEAMASGLPVVATNTGGNKELVEAGVTGALVRPGDSKSLAQAIGFYAADAELRVQHGRAARERVVAMFSLSSMIHNYKSLYEEMLETDAA